LQHEEALAGGIADMAQEALKYCLNNVPDMFETYEELDSDTAKLLVKFFIMGYGCGINRSVQDEAADESEPSDGNDRGNSIGGNGDPICHGI
jgi:hypothetical protein